MCIRDIRDNDYRRESLMNQCWLINKEWSVTLPELVVASMAHRLYTQKGFMEAAATVDSVYE